jgi:hypothetical protein
MCHDQSEGGHQEARRPPLRETEGVYVVSSTGCSIAGTLGKIRSCNPLVRNLNPVRDPRACSIPPTVEYCQAHLWCALRSPVERV